MMKLKCNLKMTIAHKCNGNKLNPVNHHLQILCLIFSWQNDSINIQIKIKIEMAKNQITTKMANWQ